MAEADALLSRLRAVAAQLDDDALAALANKGLVRRARKDLETTRPEVVGPEGDRLRLRVGDGTVDLADPPAKSACSCPAGGVCRHILMALLYLRESAPAVPAAGEAAAAAAERPAGPATPEAIEDAVLQKWAGKPLMRKALQALAGGLPVQIEEGPGPLVFRMPTRNVVCRWLAGGGLEGMVCSCHAPGACEHKVAAVLFYQAAKGKRQVETEAPVLEASAGAPRTREALLASVGAVLRELTVLGLSRLSRATEQRLRTLAVSAHGVDLPRLEKLLRALADEIALSLARDAQAATSGLLATASRVEALRVALAHPRPALVGVHRTNYEKVGQIELIGLGARQWRTRSGYAGLTVYFWDRSANNWATWTEARPLTTGGFDPAARYHQDGPWAGMGSPAEASRSNLRLLDAFRNRVGRLSGRSATRALILKASDPRDVPGLDRWGVLAERAARLFGGGFQDRSEQDELVVLRPTEWGPPQFDEVRQELTRAVVDADGRGLALVLPHTPETAAAVTALEQHDPAKTSGLLGILRLQPGRLAVEPIALFQEKGIFNLTLDSGTQALSVAATKVAAAEEEEADADGEEPEAVPSATRLGLLLSSLETELEALAEGGVTAVRDIAPLRKLAGSAESLGLTCCARAALRLVEQLERDRKSVEPDRGRSAELLLQAYYTVRLATAQEAVAAATAQLTG
jgi:hypothetical protein